jgi:hypothetical protein
MNCRGHQTGIPLELDREELVALLAEVPAGEMAVRQAQARSKLAAALVAHDLAAELGLPWEAYCLDGPSWAVRASAEILSSRVIAAGVTERVARFLAAAPANARALKDLLDHTIRSGVSGVGDQPIVNASAALNESGWR